MRTSSSGSEREEFDDTSSGSEREVVDDTDREEEADHEEKVSGESSVWATGSKKIDVPVEIMNIVKRHTKWQTMEELDTAERKCCGVSSDSDYDHLNIELGKMQGLSSELEAYHFHHASNLNTLDKEVEKALHEVVEKYPDIESMKAYKRLSEVNKLRIRATLYYKRLDDEVDSDTADAERCLPDAEKCLTDPANAERSLKQSLKTLVRDMKKVRAASKLCVAAAKVGSRVRSFIGTLKATVDRCRRFMYNGRHRMGVELAGQAKECQKSVEDDDNEGREYKRAKLAGPAKEGRERVEEESRMLTREKFRYLCKVMKKALGPIVEDVVVCDHSGTLVLSPSSSSSCFPRDSSVEVVAASDPLVTSSSCFLRHSCTGGMIMEINPEDHLIKDLQKRLYSSTDDLPVMTVAHLLFNSANAQRQAVICMAEVEKLRALKYTNFEECVSELQQTESWLYKMGKQHGKEVSRVFSVHQKLISAADGERDCVDRLRRMFERYLSSQVESMQ